MLIEDTELMEYLDGELPPERAAWLARQIASSPDLQRREQDMQELLGICTSAFAQLRTDDPRLPAVVDRRGTALEAPVPPALTLSAAAASPAYHTHVPPSADLHLAANLPVGGRPAPARDVVDLADARARVAARRRPTVQWLRAAAVLLVVGGTGLAIGRGMQQAPAADPAAPLTSSDAALREAVAARPPAPGVKPGRDRQTGGGRTVPNGVAGTGEIGGDPDGEPSASERPAAGAQVSPPGSTPARPGSSDRDAFVEVASTAARVVGAVDGGTTAGGTKALVLSDGTRLDLAYGRVAVQQGGTPVAVTPGVVPPRPTTTGGAAVPGGVPALDGGPGVRAGRGPTGEPACPAAIRWRDPGTGVELRLSGGVSCQRLQELAAQLRVSTVPR